MEPGLSCNDCGTDNRSGRRFCAECGAPLVVACAACGEKNHVGEKFCGGCGEKVDAEAAPLRVAPHPRVYTPPHLVSQILRHRSALEGERKQVTVLFADVRDSMRLAEQAGMDRWHVVLDEFFQILAEGVHRFDGTVNQYTGDGIMALFGAPIAREDHAQRACYSALALQQTLREFGLGLRRAHGLDFAVRMGINSGEVVVGKIGDDLRMDYTAQGQTVGLAARMEQLAAADSVYVSEYTADLVAGYFDCADLGAFEIKGVSDSLRVAELRGIGAMRTRFDVSRARGFSRFVGRAAEMEVLREAGERARGGRGQVVGLVGEPGVGKSRLCHEFLGECRAMGMEVHEAHAFSHGMQISYLPVLEFLRSYFGVVERDDERVAREKIAGKLLLVDEAFRDELPLVFDFLGVRDADQPVLRLDPEVRLRRLLGAVRGLIERRGDQQPVALLFEDLHWIDGGTQLFLESLVDAVAGSRTLLIVNFRPEYRDRWSENTHYQRIPLAPLEQAAAGELLRDLLGSHPSTGEFARAIGERSAGNPFFIEELVRSMCEAGELVGERGAYRLRSPDRQPLLPESVQSVLSARIDRLSERDKLALQTAAVIGRRVPRAVMERVSELSRRELEAALQALSDNGFLIEESLFPELRYSFRHQLMREVAYRSQLEGPRRLVHAAVAEAIEEVYRDGLDERAALLALHYRRAGEVLQAARWYRRAARWAGISDADQSLRHWRALRECLAECKETPETIELGLEGCRAILNLGWRLVASGEVEEVFAEGRALAERAGDLRSLAILTNLYGNVRGMAGDLPAYLEQAGDAVEIAGRGDDAGIKEILSLDLAIANFHAGHIRQALSLVDAPDREVLSTGHGAEVFGWSAAAYRATLRGWFFTEVGRLGAAERELARAVRLARTNEEPEMQLMSSSLLAFVACLGGKANAALSRSQRAVELGLKVGNLAYLSGAWWMLGLAHIVQGNWPQAVEALERAGGTGWLMTQGRGIATQAEAQLGLGNNSGARELVEEALTVAADSHSPRCEAYARLTLARVLMSSAGARAASQTAEALASARSLADRMEALVYEPFVLLEESRLASLLGDAAGAARLRASARAGFVEIGATGWAQRIETSPENG